DSLPLAVELAAARTKALAPGHILQRLAQRLDLLRGGRDAEPRQQTLRATIEWSYDLLSPAEQQLFARLSVFAGGCTLEAAENVCEADLDTLQSLVEKSLLRFTASKAGSRYWLLETIREYAEEQVERNFDSIALRLRHAGWCCDLVDRLVGSLGRFGGDEGFGGLQEDSDNVRSALAWAWRSGENEYGLRLGAACRFWMWQGFFHDAVSWLDAAAPRIPLASLSVQLGALEAAGQIAFFVLADSERADEYWARAQAIAEELGAADELAWIESKRAGVVWERGDLRLALTLHERVLAYHRASGDRLRQADSLHDLGEVFRDLGRFEEAKVALVEADAIFREHGLDHFVANNTHSLADLALDRDDCDAAVVLYREGLEVVRRRGDQRLVAYCVAGIASVMAEQGRDEVSATLWGAACAAEEQLGFRMLPAERRRYSSRLARLEGTAAWSAGRELTLEEALVSILPP
ncbi:MAG: ATP-binding protein, partial [Gaiellaceae bacterium]